VVRLYPSLLEAQLVGELPEDATKRAEQLDQTGWAVNGQVELPPTECERLQHPGEAEVVVGVVVGQEDLAQLDQAHGRAEHLPLRTLRAVEEQTLAAAPQEQRGRRPLGRGHRAGRPEEHEVEVHGAQV
jgi:hypothetical protein